MPRRELHHPHQVISWLEEWGGALKEPGCLTLIGSAALLWHVARIGKDIPLPENSMDVDPVTDDESVAELAYDALIGSEFELQHGWHVNLMPRSALNALPDGWKTRASEAVYGKLTVIVPAVPDLMVPKLARAEPRDLHHAAFMRKLDLL